MPKLLLDEPPLVILPQLAVKIGLNEAIVLQQIHYWLQSAETHKRTGFHKKGRWWVCYSIPQWMEQFPFWSEKTVKRTFGALESQGLITGEQLSENSWDRTNWYTINYDRYEERISGQTGQAGQSSALPPEIPDPGSEPEPEGDDASGHIDPMHGDRLTLSTGSGGPHAPGQDDPVERARMTPSFRKEETTKRASVKKTTTRTTPLSGQADQSLFAQETGGEAVVVAEGHKGHSEVSELVEALVLAGVGRSAAEKLAGERPEESLRQLEFLPYVPVFKSSKGAYLRKAIEEGYGPPAGWEAAQAKKAKRVSLGRQQAAQEARTSDDKDRRRQLEELKRTVRETDPKTWEELVRQAEQSLPPPIRSRPEGPGYRAAVDHKIEALLSGLYPSCDTAAS